VASSAQAGGSPPVYRPVTSPVCPSSALIDANCVPSATFERLAGAIFYTLDQTVQVSSAHLPIHIVTTLLIKVRLQLRRTGGIEVSKVITYRTMGGATVPPFYGEHVLQTYELVAGIDLIPAQLRGAPVVSWNGWHRYLLQEILAAPEETFLHLSRLLVVLNISIILPTPTSPSRHSLVLREGSDY
jgi:hypothetical protein